MSRRPARLMLVLALSTFSPAAAQVRPFSIEVSPYGGIWEGDSVLDNGPTFGGRVGFNLTRVLGLEATYGVVLTTEATDGAEVDRTVSQFGFDALLNLSSGALVPYLTAGAGFVKVSEVDFAANAAIGARYYFTDMIGARLDFRGWFSGDAPADDDYNHFEATLGLALQFGGDYDIDDDGVTNRDDKCPTRAEDRDSFQDDDGCAEDDNDADGIKDADDKCPGQPEDKDGDRDTDGCPDLDDDNDGILNEADKCPAEAEDKDAFQDDDGCPEADNDGDGILDAADKCPGEAEDKDSFQDDDGCPEADNDGDGIADAADKCPNEAEDKDGDADDDGCPDLYKAIVVHEDRIELKQMVHFATGKDRILPDSFALLNEVAQALKDNPAVAVRIEGHTDDQGSDRRNKTLSQKRADAVRKYLIDQGIAGERMEAVGFGEEKPLQDNKTDAGRAANRRVEFNIIKK